MLSFAEVSLDAPDPQLIDWCRRSIDYHWFLPWGNRRWPGKNLTGLGFIAPAPDLPVEVGTLRWPKDASCWASAHYLVTLNQLTAIRQAVYAGGGVASYQPLVISDGRRSISTQMWMLPPRPLAQIAPGGLWLLSLVDERFWHWFRAADITVTGGTTTWAQLYASIGTVLGITIAVDPIPAAYLSPPSTLTAHYEALPLLLDAVAYSVGQRIVRGLDGSLRAQNAQNAATQVGINLAASNPVRAGGLFALGDTDLAASLPATVTTTFPRFDGGNPSGTQTAYPVTLSSLNLPDFSGVQGVTNAVKYFHSTAAATWTGGGAPTNDAELTALAQQIATDYYRWRASPCDICFSGVDVWVPEGQSELIEWRQTAGDLHTRIRQGVWLDTLEELLHQGTGTFIPCGTLSAVRTYTSNATWTKPASLAFIEVECVGGGGGAGGVQGGSNGAVSGGGGAGAYARSVIGASSLPATVAVTIGTGGSGGAAGPNDGTDGGTTSFGGLAQATGGLHSPAGTSPATPGGRAAGGSGGTGTGDLTIAGGSGGYAVIFSDGTQVLAEIGGPGVAPIYGTPVTGAQLYEVYLVGDTGGQAGTGGSGFGNGGGGAWAGTPNRAGGNGSPGLAVVREYSNPC